jgi:hypothetical protein
MDWGTGQSSKSKVEMLMKPGLYANIHAKRARIKAGSGEKMATKASQGRPSAQDFKDAAKTAKPQSRREMIASKMKDM